MIAKKLAPTWFCDSIYDINPDVLLKNNIKFIPAIPGVHTSLSLIDRLC
jgi:hypothetical protein